MPFTFALLLGSVRDGRMCTRVGTFIKKHLEARNNKVIVFDPLEMKFPLVTKPLHFHAPSEVPPDWLVKYNKILEDVDGYVVISGEYNCCIPPALTNMMDHFPPNTFKYKPCSIICYSMGPLGGAVAGNQLRCFLGELGMVTPGFMYSIPVIHKAFSEDGTPDPSNDTAVSKANRMVTELEWYAAALKTQSEKHGRPQ